MGAEDNSPGQVPLSDDALMDKGIELRAVVGQLRAKLKSHLGIVAAKPLRV
ncbi:MAG: hypothetical protein IPM54_25285 [Polyangiaceae bacterium]|nr:hypothetical protein [Polyangiaceae bacterium]